MTTGGESWLDESMQSAFFDCAELDILAIHQYGTGDFDESKLSNYVKQAQEKNKMLMVQEWCAAFLYCLHAPSTFSFWC